MIDLVVTHTRQSRDSIYIRIVIFKIYDKDRDGKLSKDDLAHVRIHVYVHG